MPPSWAKHSILSLFRTSINEVFHINAVGIIAEYNPFHNGHRWHAAEAKLRSGCPYSVAVMSGQFTQRGEPAAFDKWTRASMAVASGVDLVLELPTVFAVRSAQYFATAGVRLLHSLGIVSHLAFGAETPNQILLQQAADFFSSDELRLGIRERLAQGKNYAAAIADCLTASGTSLSVLSQPNNILGVEYLRATKHFAPEISPLLIPRMHSQYHDTEITTPFASATAVRKALQHETDKELQQALPETSMSLITQQMQGGRGPVTYENLELPLLYKMRTASLDEIAELPDVSEGLQYKMSAAALQAKTVEEWLLLVKSKRYTRTRLQRALIHSLLGITKKQIRLFDECGPLYARVLAFNPQGRILLRAIADHSSITIITKTAHSLNTRQRDTIQTLTPLQEMLAIDTRASDIYVLGFSNKQWRSGGDDFRHSPVYLDLPQ